MTTINIDFHSDTQTFIASDESMNNVSFRYLNNIITKNNTESISIDVRPMQAVLMSLGTCSGLDILSIFDKMKISFSSFSIQITGEREPNKIPSLWQFVQMHFIFTGNIPINKAQRAVDLSIEKYCSVAETLRRAGCTITHQVTVNPTS